MTAVRADPQIQPYARRRSNTVQSVVVSIPTPALKLGDFKVLNSWVHDAKESPKVIFNQSWWPGVAEGDVLRVTSLQADESSGYLFTVPKDEGCSKPTLQVLVLCLLLAVIRNPRRRFRYPRMQQRSFVSKITLKSP